MQQTHCDKCAYIYIERERSNQSASRAVSGLTQIAINVQQEQQERLKQAARWWRPEILCVFHVVRCCCLVSMQCESVCMPLGLGLWHNRPQQQQQQHWRRNTNFIKRHKSCFAQLATGLFGLKRNLTASAPARSRSRSDATLPQHTAVMACQAR